MAKLKKIEPYVLEALERYPTTRDDDYILYGAVLKRLGFDLDMPLRFFLANAKRLKMPSFKSVERCRRHICELRQDLVGKNAVAREDEEEDYKEYNITGIGD